MMITDIDVHEIHFNEATGCYEGSVVFRYGEGSARNARAAHVNCQAKLPIDADEPDIRCELVENARAQLDRMPEFMTGGAKLTISDQALASVGC